MTYNRIGQKTILGHLACSTKLTWNEEQCAWKSEFRVSCTLTIKTGCGFPVLWLGWKNGLRITYILTRRAGCRLPVFWLEERVADFLYSYWKSGLRITCTLCEREGYGLPVLGLEERVSEDGSLALASPASRRCRPGPSVRLREK
jgi:hypothetical protein